MKRVAGRLRIDLAQYRELQAFAKFGSDLDKRTQAQLTRGEKMMEVLKQDLHTPMPVEKQVAVIFLGVNGYLDDIPTPQLKRLESEYLSHLESKRPELLKQIADEKDLSDQLREKLKEAAIEFLNQFNAKG